VEHLARRLSKIPGVVAVVLGGSRATGRARPHSDWDFGLYYRGTLDPADVRALGFEGEVFGPGEWGLVVNGGAWLVIDGQRVDLIYRDLDQVEEWTRDAEQGCFRVYREVGYVAGIPTYVAPAELALQRVLIGSLPAPAFPDALRETAPRWWRRVVTGALNFAAAHALRDDAVGCAGNLAVAVLGEAHARLCEGGTWYLPEKDLLAQAGLDHVQPTLRALGSDLPAAVDRVRDALGDADGR
jgi:predicted nucleotidyltransferase